MPRARYRPFTLYEEIVGLKNARKMTFVLASCLFFNLCMMNLIQGYTRTQNMHKMTPPTGDGLTDHAQELREQHGGRAPMSRMPR